MWMEYKILGTTCEFSTREVLSECLLWAVRRSFLWQQSADFKAVGLWFSGSRLSKANEGVRCHGVTLHSV